MAAVTLIQDSLGSEQNIYKKKNYLQYVKLKRSIFFKN